MRSLPLATAVVAAFSVLFIPDSSAELVLLKSGEKLEGEIVIPHNRGILFREKEGAPGRYYAHDEVNRVATKDGKLYYLMPRVVKKEEKKSLGFFPFARTISLREKRVIPIPYITLPSGDPVEARCAGAEDAVTIQLEGGAKVRLLGVAAPHQSAGRKIIGEASNYLSNRVKGKTVLLFPGPQDPRNGELVEAYVVLDNVFLNAELLEKGWVRAASDRQNHPYRESFSSLHNYAKSLGCGIWSR